MNRLPRDEDCPGQAALWNAPSRGSSKPTVPRRFVLCPGLIVLLAIATLGQGGAAPGTLLIWHGLLVALLVFALVAGRGRIGSGAPAAGPLTAFALFLAAAMAGAVVAPYGYAAFLLMLELAAFLAVGLLAARCGPGLASRVAGPLLLVAGAQGGWALWQRFVAGQPRPAGTFQNENHLGAWLAAVLLLNAGVLLYGEGAGRSRWPRAVTALPVAAALLIAGVALFALLALTQSRGAFLGLAVGVAYLLWRAWAGLSSGARRAAVVSVALAGLVGGLFLYQRFQRPDPYPYHRVKIWKASLQAVVESPWTGTGPRQFAAAAPNLNFPDGVGPLRYDRSFDSTHSDLLRLPCEFGWPATAAMLAAVLLAAREIRRRRRAGKTVAAQAGAVAALLALGAQALVESLSARPAIYLLAAVLLGSLLSRESERQGTAPAPLRACLAALLLLVYSVGDVGPYLAWETTARLPRGHLGPQDSRRLEQALRWNPLHPDAWLREAQHQAGDGSDWNLDRYAAARRAFEEAIRLQPAGATYRLGAARIEALACRTLFEDLASRRRAAGRFREAEARARHDPFLPLELGGFLLDTGDPGSARRAAERALAIEPQAVPARLMLAEALLDGRAPRARIRAAELLEQARAISERWARQRAESPYSRELLTLNSRAVARIEEKIAALPVAGGDPDPSGGG